jgi:DNA repair exonuclease SbcCD ATPase subunit
MRTGSHKMFGSGRRKLKAQLAIAMAERDAYLMQRDIAIGERNEFVRQLEDSRLEIRRREERQREEQERQREEGENRREERNELIAERDHFKHLHGMVVEKHSEMRNQRDKAIRDLDALKAENAELRRRAGG